MCIYFSKTDKQQEQAAYPNSYKCLEKVLFLFEKQKRKKLLQASKL